MDEINETFKESVKRFEEVLQETESVITRDAAIKRFELTTELAWKVLQKHLAGEGIVCNSPRRCLQEGFKLGLVEDDGTWNEIIETRNLTVHTYDEELAEQVYGRLAGYLPVFALLAEKIGTKSA